MPSRRTTLLGPTTLLVGLLAGGCAIPFGSPPVQVQTGVGMRRIEGSPRSSKSIDYPAQLKVGVHPLGLLRGWTRRRVDVGAGYIGDFDGTQSVHGAYAEVAPTLLTTRRGPIRRVSLRGQGRALHAVGYPGLGYGGAIQISAEIGGFVPGDIEWRPAPTSGATGYGWGESTVGLYAEMGYAQFDTLRIYTMTAGLQWRLPATIGVLFAALGDEKEGLAIQRRQEEDEPRDDEPRDAPSDEPALVTVERRPDTMPAPTVAPPPPFNPMTLPWTPTPRSTSTGAPSPFVPSPFAPSPGAPAPSPSVAPPGPPAGAPSP